MLGIAQLVDGHDPRTAALSTTRSRRNDAFLDALADEVALHLGEGSLDLQESPAGGCGRAHRRIDDLEREAARFVWATTLSSRRLISTLARPPCVAFRTFMQKDPISGAIQHLAGMKDSNGYTLYRHLTASGLTCRVIAPSRTPRKPGDRIKNDTRDAVTLARLLRAGELTFVWVPDEVHEAMRDLVRARQTAANDVRQARAHIQMFLLKHGIRYLGKPWGFRHRVWLADRQFPHAAQQLALQSYVNRLDQAESRKRLLEEQLAELVPAWSLAPVVTALQALKGIQLVIAATLVAEVGDFSRFRSRPRLGGRLPRLP